MIAWTSHKAQGAFATRTSWRGTATDAEGGTVLYGVVPRRRRGRGGRATKDWLYTLTRGGAHLYTFHTAIDAKAFAERYEAAAYREDGEPEAVAQVRELRRRLRAGAGEWEWERYRARGNAKLDAETKRWRAERDEAI